MLAGGGEVAKGMRRRRTGNIKCSWVLHCLQHWEAVSPRGISKLYSKQIIREFTLRMIKEGTCPITVKVVPLRNELTGRIGVSALAQQVSLM